MQIRSGVFAKVANKQTKGQTDRQRRKHNLHGGGNYMYLNEPLDPFPFFGWLLNKKAARVEVNISLAFLYWVRILSIPDLSSLI